MRLADIPARRVTGLHDRSIDRAPIVSVHGIAIESTIAPPASERGRRRTLVRDVLDVLDVGQSAAFAVSYKRLYLQARRCGAKAFTIRQEGEGFRVWRVR